MQIRESELAEYAKQRLANYEGGQVRFSDPILGALIAPNLRNALSRLNNAPSDHPVHCGTNGRPTLFKLDNFLRDILRRNSGDDEARWSLIAHALYLCDNDFGRDDLEALVERDADNLRWLVAAATWVVEQSGFDTTNRLRESLVRLRSKIPNFDAILRRFSVSQDPYLRRAANGAIAVLNGAAIRAVLD